MEELQTEREELATLDQSVFFLVLLILGVLISFSATVEQRSALARALCRGEPENINVLPKRCAANALIVGTTGFFAWLACRAAHQVQEEDCAGQRSARTNLLASLLVFAAALLRWSDLRQMMAETP